MGEEYKKDPVASKEIGALFSDLGWPYSLILSRKKSVVAEHFEHFRSQFPAESQAMIKELGQKNSELERRLKVQTDLNAYTLSKEPIIVAAVVYRLSQTLEWEPTLADVAGYMGLDTLVVKPIIEQAVKEDIIFEEKRKKGTVQYRLNFEKFAQSYRPKSIPNPEAVSKMYADVSRQAEINRGYETQTAELKGKFDESNRRVDKLTKESKVLKDETVRLRHQLDSVYSKRK